jgi:hypothetical protein
VVLVVLVTPRRGSIGWVSDAGAAAGDAVVLVVLVLPLAEGASAESATMALLQEAQWCSSCLCFFSRRGHRLSRRRWCCCRRRIGARRACASSRGGGIGWVSDAGAATGDAVVLVVLVLLLAEGGIG